MSSSSSSSLRYPEVVVLYASVSADHSAKGKTDEIMGLFEGACVEWGNGAPLFVWSGVIGRRCCGEARACTRVAQGGARWGCARWPVALRKTACNCAHLRNMHAALRASRSAQGCML